MTERDTRDEVVRQLEDAHTILDCSASIDRDEATRVYNAVLAALTLLRSAPPDETQARGWQDIAAYEKKVDSRESVLIAVQIGEKVIVGEAYWWDAGDHDRFNDTGWWWANTAWGEHGESRIADPVLAWQPMPSPPAQTEDR